jgi:hypothetical protein
MVMNAPIYYEELMHQIICKIQIGQLKLHRQQKMLYKSKPIDSKIQKH